MALIDHIPCIRCGYDLHGLDLDDCCPECSAHVAITVRGDLLRYTQAEYRRALARGGRCTLLASWGVALCIVLLLATMAVAVLTNRVAGGIHSAVEAVLLVVLTILPLTLLATWLAGSWWLLSPEPNNPTTPEMTRRAARAMTVACVVLGVAFVATIPFTRDSWTGSITGRLWLLLLGAHAVLACWYLGVLSARLNATIARKRFRQLALALPIIAAVESVRSLGLPIPYLDIIGGLAGLVTLAWFVIFPLTLHDFAIKLLAELRVEPEPLASNSPPSEPSTDTERSS